MMKLNANMIACLITIASLFLIRSGCQEDDWDSATNIYNDLGPSFTIYPETGNTSTFFEFDASSSTYFYAPIVGPGSVSNVGSGFVFQWDWEGDGIWDTDTTRDTYAGHRYSTPGSYNVTLKVLHIDKHVYKKKSEILIVTEGAGVRPAVTTDLVTNISETQATCGGEVVGEGSSPVTSRGVCWGPGQHLTLDDAHTEDGSGLGAFVSTMTGLEPNQKYFVEAYATSSIGSSFGYSNQFTTTYTFGPCPETPTVEWQGQTYNTVQIGDQCWMTENLNWETGNSLCYDNDPANCAEYGRLYDWETMMNGEPSSNQVPSGVQGICPDGWHIPSDDEWKILEGFADQTYLIGDTEFDKLNFRGKNAGLNLKSTRGWQNSYDGDDLFGFTVPPGGRANIDGVSEHMVRDAYFWTSTESSSSAYFRHFFYFDSNIERNPLPKGFYHSVRCLKD